MPILWLSDDEDGRPVQGWRTVVGWLLLLGTVSFVLGCLVVGL